MKNIRQTIIKNTARKILPILREYNVTKAGIFGSYSRGDFRKNSDIDLLVEIKKRISLLDFVSLKLKLEDALHKKVDLVEYNSIKLFIRENVLREEIRIL